MRHSGKQTAQIALVLRHGALMASAGVYADMFASAAAYVARQFGAVDALAPGDHFGIARTHMLSLTGAAVTSASGHVMNVDGAARGSRPYDLVILCDHDGRDGDGDGDGRNSEGEEDIAAWLVAQNSAGASVAASGRAVRDLARTGLLVGRRATAPWWMKDVLAAGFPDVGFDFSLAFTEDEHLFCSIGPAADAALALLLVERYSSPNLARWLARQSLIDRRQGGSARVMTPLDLGLDPLVSRARHWLEERFSLPVRVEALAAAMQVDRRTLARHFQKELGMTPLEYLQMLRVEAAKRMLRRSAFSIERIAGLIGYADAASFRQVFVRRTGSTPRSWRVAAQMDPSEASGAESL